MLSHIITTVNNLRRLLYEILINPYICSIAHTVHESVTEQASILVNGKLKEYQIKVIFVSITFYQIMHFGITNNLVKL